MIALKSNRFARPRPALANEWVIHQNALRVRTAKSLKPSSPKPDFACSFEVRVLYYPGPANDRSPTFANFRGA
jgi:hypothetical protein